VKGVNFTLRDGKTEMSEIFLKKKTLAELAGIRVEKENKWLTLIQNASKLKVKV